MPRPSHSSGVYHHSNIWWAVQIIQQYRSYSSTDHTAVQIIQQYRSYSYTLCILLHSLVTSSILGEISNYIPWSFVLMYMCYFKQSFRLLIYVHTYDFLFKYLLMRRSVQLIYAQMFFCETCKPRMDTGMSQHCPMAFRHAFQTNTEKQEGSVAGTGNSSDGLCSFCISAPSHLENRTFQRWK